MYYYSGPIITKDFLKIGLTDISSLTILIFILGLVGWIIILLGWYNLIKKENNLSEYYFLFYLLLIFLFPFISTRYLVPILPLIILYFLVGIKLVLTKLVKKENVIKSTYFSVIIILFIVSLMGSLYDITKQHQKPYYPDDWQDYYEASLWMKNLDNATINARKCELTYLWSGKKCVWTPYKMSDTETLNFFKENNVKYILIDSFKWTQTTKEFIKPVILNHPKNFTLIRQIDNTEIYTFNQ